MVVILFAVAISSISVPYRFPLFGPLLLSFCILNLLVSRNIFITINRVCVLYFSSATVFVLAYLFDTQASSSVLTTDIVNIFESVALYYLLSQVDKHTYKKMMNTIYVVGFAVSCLISLLAITKYLAMIKGYMLPMLYAGLKYPVGTSLVIDYNSFALALTVGLIPSIALLEREKSKRLHLFIILGILLVSVSIMFSASRRGWVILILYYIFLIMNSLRRRSQIMQIRTMRFSPTVFIVILTGAAIFLLYINKLSSAQIVWFYDRLKSLNFSNFQESFSPRTSRIDFGIDLFKEGSFIQKLFGNGFSYLFEFGEAFLGGNGKVDYPHNHFVSSLLYSGIVGMLLFIAFLGKVLHKALTVIRKTDRVLFYIFFINLLVISVSSNSFFSNTLNIYITMLVMCFPNKATLGNKLEKFGNTYCINYEHDLRSQS